MTRSRAICVQSATHIGDLLDGYKKQHGDAASMSGVGLHPISTAATVLIAEIVDRKKMSSTAVKYGSTTQQHLRCLKRCILTLAELEKTYLVAKRVRKIIRMLMRLCNLGDGQQSQSCDSKSNANVSSKGDAPTTTMQELHAHVPFPQQYSHESHAQYQAVSRVDSGIAVAPSTTHHSHPAMDLNFLTWNQGTSMANAPTWDPAWAAQDLL